MRFIISIAIALLVTGLVHLAGLPTTLGAHPFWATQGLWAGAVIGIVLCLVTSRLAFGARVIGGGVLTVVFYAVFITGKSRFAASYADDAFAGQMWFFGWYGVCAFAIATVATAFSPRSIRN